MRQLQDGDLPEGNEMEDACLFVGTMVMTGTNIKGVVTKILSMPKNISLRSRLLILLGISASTKITQSSAMAAS